MTLPPRLPLQVTQLKWLKIVYSFKRCKTAVPNLFGTRDWFPGRQFFHGPGGGDGFRMIQAHYIQAHLLLCGPVPNWLRLVLVRSPNVGDPCCRRLCVFYGIERVGGGIPVFSDSVGHPALRCFTCAWLRPGGIVVRQLCKHGTAIGCPSDTQFVGSSLGVPMLGVGRREKHRSSQRCAPTERQPLSPISPLCMNKLEWTGNCLADSTGMPPWHTSVESI